METKDFFNIDEKNTILNNRLYAIRESKSVANSWEELIKLMAQTKSTVYEVFGNNRAGRMAIQSFFRLENTKYYDVNVKDEETRIFAETYFRAQETDSCCICSTGRSYSDLDIGSAILLYQGEIVQNFINALKGHLIESDGLLGEMKIIMSTLSYIKKQKYIKRVTIVTSNKDIRLWVRGYKGTNNDIIKKFRDYIRKISLDLEITFLDAEGHLLNPLMTETKSFIDYSLEQKIEQEINDTDYIEQIYSTIDMKEFKKRITN